MTHVSCAIAGFVVGVGIVVAASAVGQDTALRVDPEQAPLSAYGDGLTVQVTAAGVLLARCVKTEAEAKKIGLPLDGLPRCRNVGDYPFRIAEGARHFIDGTSGDWVWERCEPKKPPPKPAPDGSIWLILPECTEIARWPHGQCSFDLARYSPWGEHNCAAWRKQ